MLVEILAGNPAFVERAATIPLDEQAVPIIVVEEIVRARLNSIRKAEAGQGKLTVSLAYEYFARSFIELRRLTIVPYSEIANQLVSDWRIRKIRVGTHDLRIGATCVDIGAKLVSRNRRDFDQIPGIDVEYW